MSPFSRQGRMTYETNIVTIPLGFSCLRHLSGNCGGNRRFPPRLLPEGRVVAVPTRTLGPTCGPGTGTGCVRRPLDTSRRVHTQEFHLFPSPPPLPVPSLSVTVGTRSTLFQGRVLSGVGVGRDPLRLRRVCPGRSALKGRRRVVDKGCRRVDADVLRGSVGSVVAPQLQTPEVLGVKICPTFISTSEN